LGGTLANAGKGQLSGNAVCPEIAQLQITALATDSGVHGSAQ